MSNLKTREFWVSDEVIGNLRDHEELGLYLSNKTNPVIETNKIILSFEDKPKTITISEDEFDEIVSCLNLNSYENPRAVDQLKKKLFEGAK